MTEQNSLSHVLKFTKIIIMTTTTTNHYNHDYCSSTKFCLLFV